LFGSEAAAGKSLGTDLAKGKLTLPVLLLWERANAADRGLLRELVQEWKPGSMRRIAKLLAKYTTLTASLEIISQYLGRARQFLQVLPVSSGRSGLSSLTEYLAQQTDALRAAPENGL
jgi:octaprenyl-diphosphate synthase